MITNQHFKSDIDEDKIILSISNSKQLAVLNFKQTNNNNIHTKKETYAKCKKYLFIRFKIDSAMSMTKDDIRSGLIEII